MPKKKIIHIIQSLGNGGCENMLLRTLPLLQSYEHKIVTLKESGDLAPKFVSAHIPVETIYCKNFFDIPGVFRLRKIVRKENPDIILTYLFHADILGRLTLYHTTTAPIIPFLRTTYNHPRYLIARVMECLTKPLVKQYLANSEAVKNFYVTHLGVNKEKITVIPNGIDTEYFDTITPNPELRTSLGIKSDDFVIICVANLHINKGQRYLLEAFEAIYKEHANTQLLLVGDGIERNNLEKQAKAYQSKNNIFFLGKQSNVPQLLKISDLFVLPTFFEGQSNALLEAMAANIPIITTNIPENKIILNADNTLLVRPKDVPALVTAMTTLITDKIMAATLSKNARQSVRQHFSLPSVVKNWDTFLSTL